MAREYEMLFKLNAQMSSAYQQTFKTAQASFKNFGTEYRAMASTASDITAYQRQQSACESTKSKLDMLQQQYDNIQREMDETGNHSSDLQNKLLAKKAQIDKTTAAYQQQMEKLEAYRQRLEGAGVDTDNLTDEEKRLREELERLRKELEEGGEEEKKFGEKGKDAMSELGGALAAAGITQGLKKIAQEFAECINVTAEFEAGVSQIAATMGVTTDEITDLSAFAKEMGAATSFSAVESADALNVLAMAGLSAEQQMSALPTVLDLAAAGAMDISTAAGYVTGAVKGFSDEMGNSAYYADLMAKGATMANTDVDALGAALSTAAATASSYGQEADSMTVALLRLAEQNVVGSEAATKLNRAMADLYTPTDEAAGALRELGIATYDERGNARDLNTVMDELNTALSAYSMEQQNAYKDTIFSMNGLQAFNKMTVSSTETVEKFWDGIANASGSASEQAATQLDNFKGSVTIMNSAIEGTKIALGELYTGAMQDVADLGASMFSGITTFIQQNPAVVKGIVAVTAGVAAFVVGLTAYVVVAKLAKAATDALTAAMDSNPYLLLGSAVAGIVVALTALSASFVTAKDEASEYTAATKAQIDELAELNRQYDMACAEHGELSDEAITLKLRIEELTEDFEKNKQTVQDYEAAIEELNQKIAENEQKYNDTCTSIEDERDNTMELIAKLEVLGSSSQQAARNQALIVPIIDELNSKYGDLGLTFDALTGKFNMTTDEIRDVAEASFDAQKAAADWEKYITLIGDVKAKEDAVATATANVAAAQDELNKRQKIYDDFKASGWEYWGDLLFNASDQALRLGANVDEASMALDYANDKLDEETTSLEALQAEMAAIEEEYGFVADATEESGNAFITYEDAVGSALTSVEGEVEELAKAYDDARKAAYDSISSQIGLFEEMSTETSLSVDDMQTNLQSQVDYLNTYAENLRFAAEYGISDGLIAALSDGSTESAGYLQAIVENVQTLGEGSAAAQQFVDDFNGSFAEVETAKKNWSDTVGDMQENFSKKVDEIEKRMETAIDDLNMETEAAQSAKETMEAYAQAIRDGTSDAVLAAQSAANQIRNALNISAPTTTGKGYASGTESATPGFHLVGEEGPELLFFNGGEQVLDAQQTASLMRGPEPVGLSLPDGKTETHSYGDIIINVNANGSGSEASPEDIAETVKVAVLDALGDLAEDRRRRAYV